MIDYTPLITAEHNQQPQYMAMVALVTGAIASITAVTQSIPGQFDLDYAIGAQLDIVGKWIGQSRVVTGVLEVGYFGFSDDSSALGFGELGNPAIGGQFFDLNTGSATASTVLADPEYRIVLRAKIIKNQYDGSMDQLAAAAAVLLGVPCLFLDPGTRIVTIVVTQAIDATLQALLTGYDLLPRPAGKTYSIVLVETDATWSTAGTATYSGTTAAKPTGSAGWDSSAYVNSPAEEIYLSWTVPDTVNDLMGGLAASPATSPNETNLSYGIRTEAGSIYSYQSGTQSSLIGTYVAGDNFAAGYDGSNVTLWHNGVLLLTTAATGLLAPMFCLNSVGAQAQNILLAEV